MIDRYRLRQVQCAICGLYFDKGYNAYKQPICFRHKPSKDKIIHVQQLTTD